MSLFIKILLFYLQHYVLASLLYRCMAIILAGYAMCTAAWLSTWLNGGFQLHGGAVNRQQRQQQPKLQGREVFTSCQSADNGGAWSLHRGSYNFGWPGLSVQPDAVNG